MSEIKPALAKSVKSKLFPIQLMWIGEKLKPLDVVCLLSMLRQGHQVHVHGYGRKPADVPQGVQWHDANDVLPFDKLLRHAKTNSPALGTNVFRYKLQKLGLGLWLDTDVLMLRPLPVETTPVFGWQDRKRINGAVLFLPRDSAMLDGLTEFVENEYLIPPFYHAPARWWLKARAMAGRPLHVSRLPWGVFGPDAITYFAKKNGLAPLARKPEVFYPVHYEEAHLPFIAGSSAQSKITAETICVHLWNNQLRKPSRLRPNNPHGRLIVDPGSFVETFARKELGFRLESE